MIIGKVTLTVTYKLYHMEVVRLIFFMYLTELITICYNFYFQNNNSQYTTELTKYNKRRI